MLPQNMASAVVLRRMLCTPPPRSQMGFSPRRTRCVDRHDARRCRADFVPTATRHDTHGDVVGAESPHVGVDFRCHQVVKYNIMTKTVNILTDGAKGTPERDIIDIVSRRIQAKRRERRLSLDQLSARAGVSKGMLVQIERGATNPSIGTLCKVAVALGASLADLVDVVGSSRAAVVPAPPPRVLWKGPKGGSATLLVGSTGPDMLELWAWDLRWRALRRHRASCRYTGAVARHAGTARARHGCGQLCDWRWSLGKRVD